MPSFTFLAKLNQQAKLTKQHFKAVYEIYGNSVKFPAQIEKGRRCFRGPQLIALPTPGCHEVEAILTMKAKNNVFSLVADNSQ